MAQFVREVRTAGPSITVVKTTIGSAGSVAAAIDKAGWHEVVGTVSGDDTIFIATADARAQARGARAAARSFWSLNKNEFRGQTPIVLAYSGGLDTSFLVPWLKENYGRPIITVTVDTGGIDAAGAKTLAERSKALGAIEHHQIDARADYFEQVLRFLIMGNVRRGQLYPLCVGAERVMQAQTIALHGAQARHELDRARLHGRGQRPGALRSRAAHARAGARGHRAGARQGVQAPGRARLSDRRATCRCRRTAPRTRSIAACGA